MSTNQLQYSAEETSICHQICCGIGVVGNRRSKWWEAYKNKILETLNAKRADMTSCIKRIFLSKFLIMGKRTAEKGGVLKLSVLLCYYIQKGEMAYHKKKRKEFPTLEEILLLSKGGNKYRWLCSKMMKCVIGCNVWNRRYFKEPLSDIATCSDEAFLLLTIENNNERWREEAVWIEKNRDKEDPAEKKFSEARYTNSGCSKANGRSKCFQGWSHEGYL